ncbi:MAG: type II secretion system protein GspM [Pseudomonadota bacterium]
MMTTLHRHRAVLAPALTLFAMLLLAILIYLPVQAQRDKYERAIASQNPRIERLLGLRDAAPRIVEQTVQARQLVNTLAYPSDADANRLNNELPNRLRQLAQQSGLTLGAMRPLPTRNENGLDILLVNLSLQGELTQFQNFLVSLEQPPRLWVDSLSIRRQMSGQDARQTLTIDMNLAALRRTDP